MFLKGFAGNELHFAKTGKGQQTAQFPWLTSDFGDLGNSPYGNKVPGFMLGAPWSDDFGNIFILKIMRGNGTDTALVVGNTTHWYVGDSSNVLNAKTTDTATGASTTTVITLTTGTQIVGELAAGGAWVYDEVIARTGTPTTDGLKPIKANTANTVTVSNAGDTKYSNRAADPDAYATAPANTDALTFIRPYQTTKFLSGNATTAMCAGVAVSAVAQNDWHYEQVAGLAMVLGVGNVTALVMNAPAVPSASANGVVIGAAAVAANQVGIAAAAKATASGLVPVWLTTPLLAC